ncbi:MAG: hypothetical protein V7746_08140 [Halioglobus sp.]
MNDAIYWAGLSTIFALAFVVGIWNENSAQKIPVTTTMTDENRK